METRGVGTTKLIVIAIIVVLAVSSVVGGYFMFSGNTTEEPDSPNGELPSNGNDPSEMEINSMHFTLESSQPDENGEIVESHNEMWIQGIDDNEIDYRAETTKSTSEKETKQIYNYEDEAMYISQPGENGETLWMVQENLNIEETPQLQQMFQQIISQFTPLAEEFGEGEQHEISEEMGVPENEEEVEIKIEFHGIDEDIPSEEFTPPQDADIQPMPTQ